MPWLALLVLAAGAAAPGALAAAPDWEVLYSRDGLMVERRTHDSSRAYEVRVTAQSPRPPAAVFETIWDHRNHTQFVPYLKRLDVIAENGEERLVYEQVALPLARDRDYTVRVRKRVEADSQRYEILFSGASEAGPPPDRHHVRIRELQGRWTIEPGRDGQGSRVRYEILCEPGGAIPSWIANSAQGEAAAKLVRAMLQRTIERSLPGAVLRGAP